MNNDTEKEHKQSVTSGFENIGKFYKYFRKKQAKEKLDVFDLSVYMFMVEQSFGYVHNIQYEIAVSARQISEELGISKSKAAYILTSLQEKKLIKRTKWKDFGAKQTYKYKVIFPKGFGIIHNNKKDKDNMYDAKGNIKVWNVL